MEEIEIKVTLKLFHIKERISVHPFLQNGDHVMLISSHRNALTYAQVVLVDNPKKEFEYLLFQQPDEVPSIENKDLYGERELLQTSIRQRAMVSSIVQHCKVLIFNRYIQLYADKPPKVPKRDCAYYYRQRVNPNGSLHPQLPGYCFCGKNIRLPDKLLLCKTCGEPYHEKCVIKERAKNCLKCKNQLLSIIELDDQNSSSHRYSQGSPISRKQPRFPIQLNRSESSSSFGGGGPPPFEKTNSSPVHLKRQGSDMIQYPGVSGNQMSKVNEQVFKLENEQGARITDGSRQSTLRATVRIAFFRALMIGMAEAQSREHDMRLVKECINNANIGDFNEEYEYCKELAMKIELNVWVVIGENDIDKYKKKVSSLKMNMLDSRNYDLRLNLLNGTIQPEALPVMAAKDLAPKSLKEKREVRQKKYFEEQTLLKPEDEMIISKTHKGEDIIMGEEKRKEIDFNESIRRNQMLKENLQKQAQLFKVKESQLESEDSDRSNRTEGMFDQEEEQPELQEIKEITREERKEKTISHEAREKTVTSRSRKTERVSKDDHFSRTLQEMNRLSGINLYEALKQRTEQCLGSRDKGEHLKQLDLIFAQELEKQDKS